MVDRKIAILGCGNIGHSIAEGIIKSGATSPRNILATRRNLNELMDLSSSGVNVTTDNIAAVKSSDVIIIAVKSFNLLPMLETIREYLVIGKHIIVALTTGYSLEQIKNTIGSEIPVFRAMPNISASVGSSITCLCSSGAGENDIRSVKEVFALFGTVMMIDEDLMESATILGSCGVAFVLRFIRAMIQGGIQIGFDAATASSIVNQTVRGAAQLLIEKHHHPEFEIDKVTTPKGCTIVGLNEMEHNGFSSSLIKGIVASFEKIER